MVNGSDNWCTHLSIAFDEATKSHLSQSRSSPCICLTCHSCDRSVRKHRSHWTHLISVYGTRSCARHIWFENNANVLNVTSHPARVHLNTVSTAHVQIIFSLKNLSTEVHIVLYDLCLSIVCTMWIVHVPAVKYLHSFCQFIRAWPFVHHYVLIFTDLLLPNLGRVSPGPTICHTMSTYWPINKTFNNNNNNFYRAACNADAV